VKIEWIERMKELTIAAFERAKAASQAKREAAEKEIADLEGDQKIIKRHDYLLDRVGEDTRGLAFWRERLESVTPQDLVTDFARNGWNNAPNMAMLACEAASHQWLIDNRERILAEMKKINLDVTTANLRAFEEENRTVLKRYGAI
jgi:hypothetical protein